MQNEDSTSNDIIDFPDERKYLQTIGKAADSQPTKTKVTAFKSRVFKLIRMYSQKSTNLNPLLDSINYQIFSKEPSRMNEVVLQILNKQINLQKVRLEQLLQIYKSILLYKSKNENSDKICETFVRLLKKLLNQGGQNTIQQLLEKVFTKRSCKLNVTFFQYLARKIPATKKFISEACTKLVKGKKIRPAQIKQLEKLKNKINKNKVTAVKKEQVQQ